MANPLAPPKPSIPNPALVGMEPKPTARRQKSKTTVIRMWSGGSHLEAKNLAKTLKLSEGDRAEIVAACLGWNDI